MLKNITLYVIDSDWTGNQAQVERELEATAFTPCGSSQVNSAGWIPPRGFENGALLEAVGGQWILKLKIESKVLPPSVVKKAVKEKIKAIEEAQGRRPGKKEQKEIKEATFLELLPKAFTKEEFITVWIDRSERLLAVDSTSTSKCDALLTVLVKSLKDFAIAPLSTEQSPASQMKAWLLDEVPPDGFEMERDCELKASDAHRSAVRYSRHNLCNEEVKSHIMQGKEPTQLAMNWKDRVGFVLTERLQVKKIKIEVPADESAGDGNEDAFDADVAIFTGEISRMVKDLIMSLGGRAAFGDSKPEKSAQPEAQAQAEEPALA